MEIDVAPATQSKRALASRDDDDGDGAFFSHNVAPTRCIECDERVDPARARIDYADVVGTTLLGELPSDAEFCSWQCVYSRCCSMIRPQRSDLRAQLATRIERAQQQQQLNS